ncbi:hypothetical protein ACXJY6_07885 [Vibrio sp. RC27]
MKKSLLFLLVTFSSLANAYEGTPLDQVGAFFKELGSNSNKAVDELYASNPSISQQPQALTMMKGQVGQIAALYGEYLGSEIISVEELSPSLIRISALEKRLRHPLTWEFYFYKPEDNWLLSQAIFVDQFQNLGVKN